MADLKPCPFCAKPVQRKKVSSGTIYYECESCHMRISFGNIPDPDTAYNTRKRPPPKPKEPPKVEDPFIIFPLRSADPAKREFPIPKEWVQEYQELYPAQDVEQAFRSMRAWLISNPDRQKTAVGVRKFIAKWLSGNQDSGKGIKPKQEAVKEHSYSMDEFDRLSMQYTPKVKS